jgi:hypothetical protein
MRCKFIFVKRSHIALISICLLLPNYPTGGEIGINCKEDLMRLTEEKIKEAILHHEEEIRLSALRYFTDAYTQDESIMPLVIKAVEQYGRENAFSILHNSENLPQMGITIDWLIGELHRGYNFDDVAQDNYRFAVSLILAQSSPPLLWKRFSDIFSAPAFPEQLYERLHQRLDMFDWDWDRGWSALLEFGKTTLQRNCFTQSDIRYGNRLVESLSRHAKKKTVLALLRGQYQDENIDLLEWLKPFIMDVAGVMRLETAIPLLVDYLDDKDNDLMDSATTALERIGTDAVVQAIDFRWWDADEEFRSSAACLLDHIRGDLCVEKCIKFLSAEKDSEVKLLLADALVAQFSSEAIDPVWQLFVNTQADELIPDERDLRYRFVAAAIIMGISFPTFNEWHQDALRDNWGWFESKIARLADTFKSDPVVTNSSGNGNKC